MVLQSGRIDVHHHIIPPAFVETMQRRGIKEVAGAPLPNWHVENSISIMDACGTQTAITSLSAPGVYFGDLTEACELAGRCNEFSAEIVQRYPGRFGAFAVLPMPFTEPACREAMYALDTLNLDGVVLLGSTEGVFLGNSRFDELMFELDRRGTVVFVHPNMHQTSNDISRELDMPGFLMEFLCDTTRAALNLIFSGTMEKYPNIRWILAHAGGFLPYIYWRISLANLMGEYAEKAPQGIMHYMRRFYFDTALSPSNSALYALSELVGTSNILFGSDYPFAPAAISGLQVDALDNHIVLAEGDKYKIKRGNAIDLFPKYKTDSEVATPLPVFASESLSQKVKRKLRSPVVMMADRMRKR